MDDRQSDFNLFDSIFLSPSLQIAQSMQTIQPELMLGDSMDPLRVCKKRGFSKDGSTTFEPFDDDDLQDSDMKKFPRMKGFESPVGSERQNHSEIEKRRRDKMNAYITELSSMLPMCNAMNRKLDKLTVLRMAVQHLKSLRAEGATTSIPEARPSFLSEDELKHLVLEAAEGFLFVVSCDRARILYVSESVRNILNYSRSDLIGQSLLDYLHPRDINKVKEQLSSSDMSPRERLIDAKTMMPVKTELPQRPTHLCSGARRSFFCRMKCSNKMSGLPSSVKAEKVGDMDMCHRRKKSDRKNFTVIHCTGYLKSWPSSKMDIKEQEDSDDNCNLSCLVALGQIKTACDQNMLNKDLGNINVRPVEYVSRHSIDGKFTYVDQGATVLLGYLPQELLGTSIYEFYHQDDLTDMADIHRKVLKTKEKVKTNVYRFKSKDGSFILLRSECFSFRNPWTKDVEYIVSTNTVVPTQEVSSSGQGLEAESLNMDIEECNWEENNETLAGVSEKRKISSSVPTIGTRLGAGRIGRQIAEELIEMQRGQTSPRADSTITGLSSSAEQRKAISSKNGISLHVPDSQAAAIPTSSETLVITKKQNGLTTPPCIATAATATAGAENISTDTDLIQNVISEQQVLDDSVTQTNDGNDEAAMSIIMSLLEADAGLGGPIDFNDLPWPL